MLEQIVRPFQDPRVTAGRRIISDNTQVVTEQAQLVWGQVGTVPSPTEEPDSSDGGLSFKVETCNEGYNEDNRDTETVRVENPDDPSQYVMVQRIKTISFNKKASVLVGSLRSETTSFADIDPFAGTPWGDVPQDEHCKSTFNLKNPT